MHGATLARASALGARTTASSSSAATASRPAAPLRGVGAPGSRGGGRPGSLSRRRGVSIVAMAGRRKRQQKRKEKSSSSSPPASPSPASSGDPAASPASPSASTNDASPPRGPERLSQNDWAEIERQNAIAAAAKAAAPGPGPARDGILDKLLSSDAMLLFAVDGVCPELVNGRVAMFGFFTALIKELVTGQSFTTQLVRPCRGVVAWRAATCHVDSQQQPHVSNIHVIISPRLSSNHRSFRLRTDQPRRAA